MHWHNTDLPQVTSRRVDLLGEEPDGNLVHIELQSRNDADIPLRMAEYALAIRRKWGKIPRQLVFYVGPDPMRTASELEAESLSFRYRILDIRQIDAALLLASERLEDNIVAILAGGKDQREVAVEILRRITKTAGEERARAITELVLLAGLRVSAGVIIEKEAKNMPIVFDIMDHELFGPRIRKGREEGLREGSLIGERRMLLNLLASRFGQIPDWASQKLAAMSSSELERTGVQLLSARSLDELFRQD